MAFQKTVNSELVKGLPGQLASADSLRTLPYAVMSDGTLKPGEFAFLSSTSVSGEKFAIASAKTESAGATPIGIVLRTDTANITDILDDHTDTYEKGAIVDIAVAGDIYVTASAAVNADATAKILSTSGAVTYTALASSGETRTDTGWKVIVPQGQSSASANDLIILSK